MPLSMDTCNKKKYELLTVGSSDKKLIIISNPIEAIVASFVFYSFIKLFKHLILFCSSFIVAKQTKYEMSKADNCQKCFLFY